MVYSGYMPSKFDNFQNKPVDSATGMSYDADISTFPTMRHASGSTT